FAPVGDVDPSYTFQLGTRAETLSSRRLRRPVLRSLLCLESGVAHRLLPARSGPRCGRLRGLPRPSRRCMHSLAPTAARVLRENPRTPHLPPAVEHVTPAAAPFLRLL
ncbi:hypothetical protein TGPRC2_294370B, partial [Toxoplasma gondii TgCatPRC2]